MVDHILGSLLDFQSFLCIVIYQLLEINEDI